MKKYSFIMLITFGLLTLVFSFNLVNASLPLTGKLIMIDVGHGGLDPGTVYKDIYEKDINLSISLYLEEELSKLGSSVILIRDKDYDLSKPGASLRKRSDFDNRIKLINESKADIYLSIHLNSLPDTRYSGAQVFFDKDNEALASTIQTFINENLNMDRSIKEIPKDNYMYPKLIIPGVLIECGFLSNYEERMLLITNEYQKKLANIIANSLVSYF